MGTWLSIGQAKTIVEISKAVTEIGAAAIGSGQPARIRFVLHEGGEVVGSLVEHRFGNNGGANGVWLFHGEAIVDETARRTYVDYAAVAAVHPA